MLKLQAVINQEVKLPLSAKVTVFFIGLFAVVTLLYIAQSIIVPFVFAIIIAILLHPVVKFFVKFHINRVIAIIFTLSITFFVIVAFCILIYSQAVMFSESWPILVEKFTDILNQSITQSAGYLDIDPEKIHVWVATTKGEIIDTSSASIGQTLVTLGNALMVLLLVPVYIFLILFYQPLLLEFIHKLFGTGNKSKVAEIITQIKSVIQRYLVGLVIEFFIIAVLNSTALLILGIDYAILIGIIGALLNLIPYIGGLVAVALPMMIALATKTTGWYAIYVMIAYYVIQLVDNNYIVPIIVASKVKINALFSVLVVLVGNALWGISGMFLSIPLLAIVKLIFDHIDSLKPWGFLLGDTMPHILKIKPIFKKIKNIAT